MLRGLRFAALMLTALSAGMSFCHLLELPPRVFVFDASLWIATTTKGLYALFGTVGAAIEVGSVLTLMMLAYAVRGRGRTRSLTVAAAGLVTLALILWFVLVAPVNVELARWTPETYPAGWEAFRNRWEAGHAINAVIKIAAFALLTMSVLVETPTTISEGRARRHATSRVAPMPLQFRRVK